MTGIVALLLLPFVLVAIVHLLVLSGSDWPANCTPFDGKYQQWKRLRDMEEPEPERGWGEVAELPPFSPALIQTGTDEQFLGAVMSQPEPEGTPRYGKPRIKPLDPEEIDAIERQKRIRKEHESRDRELKRLGLKLDFDK